MITKKIDIHLKQVHTKVVELMDTPAMIKELAANGGGNHAITHGQLKSLYTKMHVEKHPKRLSWRAIQVGDDVLGYSVTVSDRVDKPLIDRGVKRPRKVKE